MMIDVKKILMPTDLSEYARHALTYASELSSTFGATLHLIYVVDTEWLVTYDGVSLPNHKKTILERLQKEGEEGLKELKRELTGVDVETVARVGNPPVAVERYARENDIDLIVLATHGRTGLSHVLFGSKAERLVQSAPCPVLTIKHPEHEFVLPDHEAHLPPENWFETFRMEARR